MIWDVSHGQGNARGFLVFSGGASLNALHLFLPAEREHLAQKMGAVLLNFSIAKVLLNLLGRIVACWSIE